MTVPPNGVHTINLMLACENLADHLSHFYLFFMPDFARPVYAQRPWFAEATRRFAAMAGEHARAAVAARQRWFEIMGTLGGKWPHTLSIQPGGSARAVEAAERIRLLAKVREFRAFLEATTFGAPLEEIAALDSEAALQRWHAADPLRGDLRLFLTLAADLKLDTLGRGPGRTLSFGAYRQPDGSHALADGVWSESLGRMQPVDTGAIREDATHAWLAGEEALHPSEGLTAPMLDKPGGYTWNKAPRLSGEVVETGAIARQLASGQPLIRDAVARCGAQRLHAGAGAPGRAGARAADDRAVAHGARAARALLPRRPPARRCRRRGPDRSGARCARPLGERAAGPHRALPDRRADELELLAARRRRHARRAGSGARRRTGAARRGQRRWPCSTSCARSTPAWSAPCTEELAMPREDRPSPEPAAARRCGR